MILDVTVSGDIRALMRRETENGKLSVSRSMAGVGALAKQAWRQQIVQAGLGTRLANTIRNETYPKGKPSLNAAALIWTKAPVIVKAHDEGPLIRAAGGGYLAIPLPEAGRGQGNRRITPAEWQFKTGRKLVFVKGRNGKASMLFTAGGSRLSKRGLARPIKRARNSRTGILSGEASIPVFILVKQTKLQKRLNIVQIATVAASRVATLIVRNWKD